MFNVIIFTDSTDNIASNPTLGPYKVAHSLRKFGYSCLVVNHLSDFSYDELTNLIDQSIDSSTFLIGFSTNFLKSIEVARVPGEPTPPYPPLNNGIVFPQGKQFENQIVSYIKQKNSKIKIVVGGTRATPHYNNKNADYVCVGYSESSIVNLANHITTGEELIKAHRNIWGINIIDDRTASDYDFANGDMVWDDVDIVNHKCLPIEIGRGCIFQCKFCSYPMNGKKVLDFVKRADILEKELQHNYDLYRITNYQIVDDTFNDHEQKLSTIQELVSRLSFKPKFWAYIRLDLLHTRPATIQQMYDIGIRGCYFGIESLNPKTAKLIGKGYDFSKSVETIRYIRETYPDVSMHGSFIIGLPHESVEQVTETLNRLITQDVPLHSWIFHPLHIEEASQMSFASEFSKNYQQYGYTKKGNISPVAVDWENEYMDSSTAISLAQDFMEQSRKSNNFKLQNTLTFQLTTMGYDLDDLSSTAFRDFDFHHCEHHVRPAFVKEYKAKLLSLISSKSKSA
jgi:radical SAM superfamily enzyme YgiQ (UPF0313 family)